MQHQCYYYSQFCFGSFYFSSMYQAWLLNMTSASIFIIDVSQAQGQSHQAHTHGLTHWGWVTHICVSYFTIIGSDNDLSPGRCQAIIWTNDGLLLIGPLGTNFSEILNEIHTFSFKKMRLKMASGKWRLSCLGLNVLIQKGYNSSALAIELCLFCIKPSIHSQGFEESNQCFPQLFHSGPVAAIMACLQAGDMP